MEGPQTDSKKDAQKLVCPGDKVGRAEEYMPGTGVFEEDGDIIALQVGTVSVDERSRRLNVMPKTSVPVVLKRGDIAIGAVYEIRKSMAVLTLWNKEGNDRPISSESMATLYISKISEEYLENMRDAFYIGDVIRARLIQSDPSVQLECNGKDLGVIFSKCPDCNIPMDGGRNKVSCPQCGKVLSKKLSSLYRNMEL